ncbi:flagellar hook-basal body complex protein [Phenylobacterium sp.]|uniref:flagellar hook-basal body complex protein n=1 Tax=Phenylobacterium sp. TaxID=1871053 RepID=UPI002BDCBD9B|nr:flagellar hook-basal body complex protein [Phenylobacterium sp.]HVI32810.1 flagellar hook-basal body complex protein [Phenylobacterium sp.]
MSDYADDPTTGTRPDFTLEMNVIDSVGGNHKVAMAFLRDDAAPNQWYAEMYSVPASDVANPNNGRPGQLAAGLVTFNQDGTINLANTTLFGAAGATPRLTLEGSDVAAPTGPQWNPALGINGQVIDLGLGKLSQYAQASTVNSVNADGAGVGNVVGVQVDESGIVSAIFDNSQIRQIAKVAIATFPNADGLKAVSGNAYRTSIDAGQLVIKEPGIGAGQISPSSLEASTVDLSAEFTGLISTQKAYSASSRIITTADQMLEELINIKR